MEFGKAVFCCCLAALVTLGSGRHVPSFSDSGVMLKSNCSVVFDKTSHKLRVVVGDVKPRVAYAWFHNMVNETGWSHLQVQTNGSYEDSQQALAAGMAEGFLTAEFISMSYLNTKASYCKGQEAYCDKLKTFITTNDEWIAAQIKGNPHSSYWHQIDLLYSQVHGMLTGYQLSHVKPSMERWDLMLLQLAGDLLDLGGALGRESEEERLGYGHCSGLIKILPGYRDLYISHVAWYIYADMLRIYKRYDFAYRKNDKGHAPVASQSISFSSYPGMVNSMDDFYILSNGMVSQETSLNNYNKDLHKFVQPQSVLCWARVMVANRLASSGNQWTSLFERYNSGTYNNQWMVLDYKLFEPGKPLKPDTVWILEQMPGSVEMADMTLLVDSQGYWPSFNMPFFANIYNVSNTHSMVEKYGSFFKYQQNPRAEIFRRDHHKVTDIESFVKLMRYNDYQHDPLSRCNCTPPYSATNAISMRGDLNPANGTYSIPLLGHSLGGGYDCKATSFYMAKNLSQVIVGGPTWDDVPPFQWSKTNAEKPLGHPDLWKFSPYMLDWNV